MAGQGRWRHLLRAGRPVGAAGTLSLPAPIPSLPAACVIPHRGLTSRPPSVSYGPQSNEGAPMTAAFTFPGQGSQAVGMGKALAEAFPAARAVFDEVDSALGEKLTAIIWEGPAETLQLTENAQPALMAVSIATLRLLETEA